MQTKIKFWRALIGHWTSMLRGHSYWHAAQGLGPCFQPGNLQDYYRDYSAKVEWRGAVDNSNFPLVQEPGGEPFHHPLTFAQKALGHWTCLGMKKGSEEKHNEAFFRLAQWFVRAQETQGSWEVLPMKRPHYMVPYSALVQGQVISVLARAFSVTLDRTYLETASRGLKFMLKPIQEGGTCRITPDGMILEEYPQNPTNTVLNGWISALYGLYDFLLIDAEADARQALEASLVALTKYLPRYNAGYWSFYDTAGTLASPYYHRVHITQLKALALTFPGHANLINQVRNCFESQMVSSVCCARAFMVKAFQKLRCPQIAMFSETSPRKLN